MKVVFCVCLVALVEAAPTIVEKVKQQDYNQPLDYNQPQTYDQPLDYQLRAYNQPLDYSQPQAYNPPLDYNQLRAYNQPLDYNQLRAYNQPLDYNQLRAYNQPLDYNQLDNQRLDYLRGRRSNQYAVVSPCAAASYSPYYSHGYPYYPGRVYRADDVEQMSFSDSDQLARSYEAPSSYGVFPNANTGGCGIPILVSCSPNVVQGRLVKAEPHSSPVNYRQPEHSEAHTGDHDAKTQ